jgi:putative intracellular protease/amidase
MSTRPTLMPSSLGGDRVKPTEPETQPLVEQAVAEGKVLTAICAGQGILKEAGLWEGGREGVHVLRRDRIVVASGPLKAREFAESVPFAMVE